MGTQRMGQVAATRGMGQVAATQGKSHLGTSAPQNRTFVHGSSAPPNQTFLHGSSAPPNQTFVYESSAPQNQTFAHGTPPVPHGQPVMYAQPSNSLGLPQLSRAQSAPNVGVNQGGVRSYSAPPQQVDAIMKARASSSPWRKKIAQQKKDSCPFGRKQKPEVPNSHPNLPRRERALNI